MDLKSELTKKIGPLPTWGWVAAGVGMGVLFLYLKNKNAASNTASTTGVNNPAAGSDLGQGGYYLGDAGSGGTIPQLPALNNTSTTPVTTPTAATTTVPVNTQNPDANTWAQNLAAGLVNFVQPGSENVGPPACTGSDSGYCTLEYQNINGIAALPIGGELVAMRYVNPTVPSQVASNNALANLVSSLPRPAPLNTNPGVNQPALAPGQLSSSSYGYTSMGQVAGVLSGH